ncbi:MAG: alkaline phosphatase family protein [Gammaproteobacteria bacterium]|nr:alkaline phosphatase family protein [Gammaproteobacteria bacterium]
MKIVKYLIVFLSFCINLAFAAEKQPDAVDKILDAADNKPNRVILLIWDGLRPDVITKENTPVLYRLRNSGTNFTDHHSSYPTVTMNNANSFATGDYSGDTGFYGNQIWRPSILGNNQPVSVEDEGILDKLDKAQEGSPLMYVETLLQIAQKNGLKTAQLGKDAPAILQNYKPYDKNIILTSTKIYPQTFLKLLQEKGYKLPSKFSNKALPLEDNLFKKKKMIELTSLDGKIPLNKISDPTQAHEANYKNSNEYLMAIYIREILTNYKPDLSVIWLNEPDSTAHTYGIGTNAYYRALKNQDQLLGSLLFSLNKMGFASNTNVIIASDHGYSNVSGDYNIFPLREINSGKINEISKNGSSTSGYIRVADLLTKAGFTAYDGEGCIYNPSMGGILSDRSLVNKIEIDNDGKVCGGSKGRLYTSKSYIVPKELNKGDIIVADNSGSVYLYIIDKDDETTKKLVRFLQSRLEFDGVFIDQAYGYIPGTLPMNIIKFNDKIQERNPDILVSLSHDSQQSLNALKGTAYTSNNSIRGSHGTLSRYDIHNTLIALGPDFKQEYESNLPSANVDVPVTLAKILNLPFDNRVGRPLLEGITNSGVKPSDYELKYSKLQPNKPATGLNMPRLDSLSQKEFYTDRDNYTFVLNTKELSYKGKDYLYLDSGKALRY